MLLARKLREVIGMKVLNTLEELEILMAATAPRLVVIDFHAAWCGPCKFVAPQYAALSQRQAHVANFCKVDVDDAQELAAFARIRAMPTFQVLCQSLHITQPHTASPHLPLRSTSV